MYQNVNSSKNQAALLSVWFLATSFSGIIFTGGLGLINSSIDALHPEFYGYTIFATDSLAKTLTLPIFLYAGLEY